LTIKKAINSSNSLDLLLINPAWIDYNIKNIFTLLLQKLVKYCPPGLLYLAANVRKHGYHVKIYDMELNNKLKDLLKFIEQEKPKIIGITALTFNYLDALKVLKKIKENNPNIITMIGGLHISRNPQDAIKKNLVDFEFIGEAEYTLIQVIDYLIKKKGSLENIPGIIYKEDGRIKVNEEFPIIKDLDSLPLPALDLIDREKYFVSFQKSHPSTIIMGSRSCPFKCIFCDKLTNIVRLRSPENVVSEIKFFYEKYNIRDFQFYDLSFNANINWAKKLCKKLIKEKLPIVWRCNGRVELVDEELIRYMKQAGCYLIAFGVESGNNSSLKFLKKGFNVKDIIMAFKLAKKYKIETHAYYIVGIPGETKLKFLNSLTLIKSIAPDYVNLATLRPFPHTELADISLREGWFDLSKINILNPDYKYQRNLTLKFEEMSPEEIIKLKKFATKAYYLNIKYILRQFSKFMKEPTRYIYNFWRSLKELIKML